MPPIDDNSERVLKCFHAEMAAYENQFLAVARSCLGGKLDPVDAIQNMYVNVGKNPSKHFDKIFPKFNFAWFTTVLQNECANMHRAVKLAEKLLQGRYEQASEFSDPNPLEAFENQEMFELLREAMEELPERERLILYDRWFAGYKQAEIAKDRGITKSRVNQILRKSLEDLRRILQPRLLPRGGASK